MQKLQLLFILLLASSLSAFSQADTVHLKRREKADIIVTDRAPQAVYFGLGGSGPIFSFNYDRRFTRKLNGPGFAAGVGYYGESHTSLLSFPVSLNYLIGRKNNFFELAAGQLTLPVISIFSMTAILIMAAALFFMQVPVSGTSRLKEAFSFGEE